MYALALSHVWLYATPWTVAYQASLSMGYSRKEYWSGLPTLLHWIFPTQGLNLGLLRRRQTLYHLSHKGSSRSLLVISFIYSSVYMSISICQFIPCPNSLVTVSLFSTSVTSTSVLQISSFL